MVVSTLRYTVVGSTVLSYTGITLLCACAVASVTRTTSIVEKTKCRVDTATSVKHVKSFEEMNWRATDALGSSSHS